MLVALCVYTTAAIFDIRCRRVPNLLWVVGLAAFVWRGVSAASMAPAATIGLAALVSWKYGEIGGADVKGLSILPIALPSAWPVAILGMGVFTAVGFIALGRDEIPLFVPILGGVALTLLLTFI